MNLAHFDDVLADTSLPPVIVLNRKGSYRPGPAVRYFPVSFLIEFRGTRFVIALANKILVSAAGPVWSATGKDDHRWSEATAGASSNVETRLSEGQGFDEKNKLYIIPILDVYTGIFKCAN